MSAVTFIDGVRDLADRYAGFIIDQWGVLHNGSAAFPGVHGVLAELQRRAKRMVLLTNSSRRVSGNSHQLSGLGFNPAMFEGIVSSGEATWLSLRHRRHPPFDRLGRRCLLVSRAGDTTPVEGLDLDLVADSEHADFVLLSWLDQDLHAPTWFDAMANTALKRGLPMVCANPDRVVRVAGGMIEAPGKYAAIYAGMGGEVVYVGKPHTPIYAACLDLLEELERDEILCVGDSLEHDIKGANAMGMDAALVLSGIHAEELLDADGHTLQRGALDPLMAEHDAKPRWVLRDFAW